MFVDSIDGTEVHIFYLFDALCSQKNSMCKQSDRCEACEETSPHSHNEYNPNNNKKNQLVVSIHFKYSGKEIICNFLNILSYFELIYYIYLFIFIFILFFWGEGFYFL